MTLNEAITHSREKAIEQSLAGFDECSKEHAQLASWLEELKWRRAWNPHDNIYKKEREDE